MIVKFINLLSFSRILFSIIIFILLIQNIYYIFALVLFFVAGLSDFLDGYLARKYNSTSVLGEILDPIADKILVVFLLIGLSVNLSSSLIAFCASVIISREIWVSALRDFNSRNNNTEATQVSYIGKIKTTIQLFTLSLYLFALAFEKMLFVVIGDIFLIAAVMVTLYSGYEYTMNTFKKPFR